MRMMSARSGSLVSLVASWLVLIAGVPVAQRAGGSGPAPNESDQLPALTAPVRISADYIIKTIDAQGASYPRVIQLQHYAPGKGQLLLTFTGGGPGGGMPIYRSTDNGTSWQIFGNDD